MYLGLLWVRNGIEEWDTCKLHAKCQDTCILFECNRACKIRLGYIKIHQDTCILQDTRRIHQDTYPDNNPPKLDNKPPQTRVGGTLSGVTPDPMRKHWSIYKSHLWTEVWPTQPVLTQAVNRRGMAMGAGLASALHVGWCSRLLLPCA